MSVPLVVRPHPSTQSHSTAVLTCDVHQLQQLPYGTATWWKQLPWSLSAHCDIQLSTATSSFSSNKSAVMVKQCIHSFPVPSASLLSLLGIAWKPRAQGGMSCFVLSLWQIYERRAMPATSSPSPLGIPMGMTWRLEAQGRRLHFALSLWWFYERGINMMWQTSVEDGRPKGLKTVVSIGMQPDKAAAKGSAHPRQTPMEWHLVDGWGQDSWWHRHKILALGLSQVPDLFIFLFILNASLRWKTVVSKVLVMINYWNPQK